MADPFASSPYYTLAQQYANARGINPQFFVAQIGQESSFNPNAINGDAVGIAQFMPKTAEQFGIDPTDPNSSLYAAATFDSELLDQCGGDYICVAQNYGTLPKSGAMSSGQLDVYDAANNANAASGYNSGFWNTLACYAGFNSRCQVAATSPAQQKQLADMIADPSGSNVSCASSDLICNAKNWLSNSGANLLGIVAGLVLLVVGLTMLKTGDGISKVPGHVAGLAKKTFKLNGEEVAALAVT